MLRSILVFLIVGALWWTALWFGIAPDFSKWSNPGLLAIHVLPPLTLYLSWWFWRRHAKQKKIQTLEEREKKAQAEQQAALEAARAKHTQEMQTRRFSCDCRVMAIGDLAINANGPLELPEGLSVSIDIVTADEKATTVAKTDLFDALEPAIVDALGYVYQECGAAAVFPIYVVPPASVSAADVIKRVREINAKLIADMMLSVKPKAGTPSVLFLPSGDSAANSVIALFENTPDLPGAVVLAFDSPLSQAAGLSSDEDASEQDTPFGKPSHGVFALLFTNADLPAMLNAVAGRRESVEEEHDSLTPFWEKNQQPTGNLALLTMASLELREELAQLPAIARIHRAAFVQTGKSKDKERVLELSRTFTTLLERAQINAGLIDVPFLSDAADGQADGKKEGEEKAPAGSRCEWLVHNAGEPGRIGTRLSAMGSALLYFKIDRNPTEIATNIVSKVGNLGRATPIGMLALALVQAQGKGAPVLCAEFSEPDGIAVAFAVPAQAS